MPRHVTVVEDGRRVMLKTDDGDATFLKEQGYWEVAWTWSSGEPPSKHIGSGVGEYSRKKLSNGQEPQFEEEIALWMKN